MTEKPSASALALIFSVLFAVVAIINIPLSAVMAATPLARSGLSYDAAVGRVWNGRLLGVRWNIYALGDADVALRPLSLLTLSPRVSWLLTGTGVTSDGLAQFGVFTGPKVKAGRLRVRLAAFPEAFVLPSDPQGEFSVEIADLAIGRSQCRAGEVAVWTDFLKQTGAAFEWEAPELSGTGLCEDGVFRAPLRRHFRRTAGRGTRRLRIGPFLTTPAPPTQRRRRSA